MSTTTRTVAEIIGFMPDHIFDRGGWCVWCDREAETSGAWCPDSEEEPAVDDMLTWLRANWRVESDWVAPITLFLGEYTASVVLTDADGDDDLYDAPTLRGALGLAVVAVAERDS